MISLTTQQKDRLLKLLAALISQEAAQVLIAPQQNASGFWFGGGNLVQDEAGKLWLCGRYRNFGDSRTGLKAGERGLEVVLWSSEDGGQSFQKRQSWSKEALSLPDQKILSYEGTALHQLSDGTWELFISSEKEIAYPEGLESYQKPGTGVWTIDRLSAASLDALSDASLEPVLSNTSRPEYLHIKDPVVFDQANGDTVLVFCSHPFSWTSTNSGYALRPQGQTDFDRGPWEVVSRGAGWDVAATRITSRMPLPQLGCFADNPPMSVYFYDGAECLRQLDENPLAHKRPRGFSCEEIGGAFFGSDEAFPEMTRLDPLNPLFMSPWGSGSSRYVETLVTEAGIYAIWQQSQDSWAQPLVSHFLPMAEVEDILAA